MIHGSRVSQNNQLATRTPNPDSRAVKNLKPQPSNFFNELRKALAVSLCADLLPGV